MQHELGWVKLAAFMLLLEDENFLLCLNC